MTNVPAESTPQGFTLKELSNCSIEQQLALRDIRNQPSIRNSMYTGHIINTNEHLKWVASLQSDNDQKAFTLLNESLKPVGFISACAISTLHKRADWAFYLDENYRNGLGVVLGYHFLNFVFEDLQLEKLNAEVIETNPRSLEFHYKLGFIKEGFRRENCEKDKKRIGAFFLGITKTEWLVSRKALLETHKPLFQKFAIVLEKTEPPEETPVDQIQKARAKNNVNWMALLRLSMEHHPHIAKPIISEILRLDTEISELTKKLVEE